MKKQLVVIAFTMLSLMGISQTTVIDSIFIGGIFRTYRLYKPAIYTGVTARPLILNLHGYTSNATSQQAYSNFAPIADTANFLMVFPQGTKDNSNQPFWNAGISNLGVNDIQFLNALIDSLDLTYNINLNRVYSTGMSNGGFMSHTLACELSNRIAAIASVTGSIFTTQYGVNCHPSRPVPVMQVSGTADGTVPFTGASTMMPIDSVVNYWVKKNNCNTVPSFSNVPNTSTADGCTAEHYRYLNGNGGSTVELYKIIGGGHTWPGSPFNTGVTNQDVKISKEIWRFFNKYTLSNTTSINEGALVKNTFSVYPNPTNSTINFKFNDLNAVAQSITVTDVLGKVVLLEATNNLALNIESLKNGIYFIAVKTVDGLVVKTKFIKD